LSFPAAVFENSHLQVAKSLDERWVILVKFYPSCLPSVCPKQEQEQNTGILGGSYTIQTRTRSLFEWHMC
jgi:hypothetical protein